MQKTDHLHQLILRLTSTEKRLFKIYVKQHSGGKEKAYLDLFDAVTKLKAYSERALLKKLPKNYNSKNLAQQKKYLKDLILKCMREIDDNRAEDTVNELMREQVFLGKKNLFKEQWKRLKRAEKLVIKFELFSRHLEILDAQMSFLIEHDFDESLKFKDVYRQKQKEIIEKINLLSELVYAKNHLFISLRKYRKSIGNPQLEEADLMITSFKNLDINRFKSFHLNRMYYNLFSIYEDLHGHLDKVLAYRCELVKLGDKYPWMQKVGDKNYLIYYFNYISALFSLQRFDQIGIELTKLSSLQLNSENERGEFFQNITLNRILYWLNTGKLEEAILMENEINNGTKKYHSKINSSSIISIYYNYALIFFCNDNFEDCIEWLEKIALIKKDVRADLKIFAKILIVICHYQLGSYLLIESLVRSIRRMFKLNESYGLILSSLLVLSKREEREGAVVALLKKGLQSKGNYLGGDIISLWIKAIVNNNKLNHFYMESIAEGL